MDISTPVVKKDHSAKVSGQAKYVDDIVLEDMQYGKLVRSTVARAKIKGINIPELPEGYIIVDKDDIPGDNRVQIVQDDHPVFADGEVQFIGECILMVVGPVKEEVEKIAEEIEIDYDILEPVLDIEKSETVFFNYNFGKGDVEKAFKEADKVYTEDFVTGYQEQAYLETQGLIGHYHGEKITVRGSMQCPYYVHGAVARTMGFEARRVQIIQDVTGGGFGGKEAFPSILACQVAVAAHKAKKPVKCVFDRREDMEYTSKRHPSKTRYKAALKDGKKTAIEIEVLFNSGAYTTLSPVVLQRGLICANGVYDVPNLKVNGRAMKTNTSPTGAYRGFGAPQTFFAVEQLMTHIANDIGMEPLDFKMQNMVKQNDPTSTGGKYHFPVPLESMIDDVATRSDYYKKREEYKNQTGRYRKGIGMSLVFHGAGFTGSGERDIIKAEAQLKKYKNGDVEILVSNTDIGQGLKTTFSKIVAKELNIPYEEVLINNPDTDRVPDSGPTVASRSLMVVGELLRRAAIKLRSQWIDGEEQVISENFVEPDFVIPFYIDKFQGDAYPTYAWGVQAVELEVDSITGAHKVLDVWASYDVGTPIDLNIVVGQMEGGLMQGLGFAHMEQMDYNEKGRIRNNSLSDYIIPTSVDVPNLEVKMHVEEYPLGPYGAKGAGELPLVGGAGAYIAAVEDAVKSDIFHHPFSNEDTLEAIKEAK